MKAKLHLSITSVFALAALLCAHAQSAQPALKTESFDRDPGWEEHNNRIMPKKVPVVKQDFGYSATHFAGKAAGEIGGRVHRTAKTTASPPKHSFRM